jgi:hypothetical protein
MVFADPVRVLTPGAFRHKALGGDLASGPPRGLVRPGLFSLIYTCREADSPKPGSAGLGPYQIGSLRFASREFVSWRARLPTRA